MDRQATILDIPLFPLTAVLFPGMTLPLYIFEERYKRMIGLCLEQGHAFGVVLIKTVQEVGSETPYDVGTVARIVKSAQLADGCYNIVTQGAARFQILESSYQSGYLTGRVEILGEEEHDVHRLAELQAAVQRRFQRFVGELAELAKSEMQPITFPDSPTAISYFVASHLPIDQWEKQRLLEATSTDVRLLEERRILGRERDLLRLFAMARPSYETGEDEGGGDGGRVLFSPN